MGGAHAESWEGFSLPGVKFGSQTKQGVDNVPSLVGKECHWVKPDITVKWGVQAVAYGKGASSLPGI